ncbi:MAG: HIT family protein [Halobacteriales archaeon]
MDQLFAPWRIEWVTRDRGDDFEGCVFCAFRDDEADRENLVVARGERAFVLLNNYPYNPGHVMVIPHDHTGRLETLPDAAMASHAGVLRSTLAALREAMAPDGFNVGYNLGDVAAGGSIGDHVHAHVVPRWSGDTNFMPVVSDTKVVVEALESTYDRLRGAFADLEGARDPGDDRAVELRQG